MSEEFVFDEFGLTFDQQWRKRFHRQVRQWFRRHARQLPWSGLRDPYKVWISEIMLQQTTVPTVEKRFHRFLEVFPSVQALAEADEAEVLRQWEGLGYYSRARNLHRAARMLVNEFGGQWPQTLEDWTKLPGVGPNTAAAILSLAFDKRAALFEANTARLYARLAAVQEPLSSQHVRSRLQQFAGWLLPSRAVASFNQALMDLGATVCVPGVPDCEKCPVRSGCQAFVQGIQRFVPVKTKQRRHIDLLETAVAVLNDSQVLLIQRKGNTWWSGLWDFPCFQVDSVRLQKQLSVYLERTDQATSSKPVSVQRSSPVFRFLAGRLSETLGMTLQAVRFVTSVNYVVTHHRVTRLLFTATSTTNSFNQDDTSDQHVRWIPLERLDRYALPSPTRKLVSQL